MCFLFLFVFWFLFVLFVRSFVCLFVRSYFILFFIIFPLGLLSDGEADYRVHLAGDDSRSPANTIGAFYRDEEGPALVMGTLDNPTSRAQLEYVKQAPRCTVLYGRRVCQVCQRIPQSPLSEFSTGLYPT